MAKTPKLATVCTYNLKPGEGYSKRESLLLQSMQQTRSFGLVRQKAASWYKEKQNFEIFMKECSCISLIHIQKSTTEKQRSYWTPTERTDKNYLEPTFIFLFKSILKIVYVCMHTNTFFSQVYFFFPGMILTLHFVDGNQVFTHLYINIC